MAQPLATTLVCDRCYKQKEDKVCDRCSRKGAPCIYSSSLPKGRPSLQRQAEESAANEAAGLRRSAEPELHEAQAQTQNRFHILDGRGLYKVLPLTRWPCGWLRAILLWIIPTGVLPSKTTPALSENAGAYRYSRPGYPPRIVLCLS